MNKKLSLLKKELKKEQPKEEEKNNMEWGRAIDILERHILHKDYVSQSSLELALERIKRG